MKLALKTFLSPALVLMLASLASAVDLGKIVFVGDSITQGGGGHPGYRYQLWEHMVDNGTTYSFQGSVTGAFQNNPGAIGTYKNQTFSNVSDGHYGWRASWESGSVALPGGRYNVNNLGQGTVANWTGQSTTFETANQGTLTYTGTTYVPDQVVMMIGVNDLSDGTSVATVTANIRSMVQQYQAANAKVRIRVASVLPVAPTWGGSAAKGTALNAKIDSLNANLAASAATWSTGTSTVDYANVRSNFTAATMISSDLVHPNFLGEKTVAANMASVLGIGGRDETLGLTRKSGADFKHFNGLNNLSATGGFNAPTGNTWTDPKPNDSLVTVAKTSNTPAHNIAMNLTNGLPANHCFTAEARVKMVSDGTAANNFVMLVDDSSTANSAQGAMLRVYADRVEWGNTAKNVLLTADNTDALHDYRVAGLSNGLYAVWRDGSLLGDNLAGDVTARTKRALFGSFSDSESISAIVDHVAFDETGSYAVPEPSSMVLCLSGLAFVGGLAYRRRK